MHKLEWLAYTHHILCVWFCGAHLVSYFAQLLANIYTFQHFQQFFSHTLPFHVFAGGRLTHILFRPFIQYFLTFLPKICCKVGESGIKCTRSKKPAFLFEQNAPKRNTKHTINAALTHLKHTTKALKTNY